LSSEASSLLLGVPPSLLELLRGLLAKDPARRLTPLDVLHHPALAQVRAEAVAEADAALRRARPVVV
jgi:serine/threonine protein kinase